MALNFQDIVRAKQAALGVPGLPSRIAIQLVEFFSRLSQYGGNPELDVTVVDSPANTTQAAVLPAETYNLLAYITFAPGAVAARTAIFAELDDVVASTRAVAQFTADGQGKAENVQLFNTGLLIDATEGPVDHVNGCDVDLRVILITKRG